MTIKHQTSSGYGSARMPRLGKLSILCGPEDDKGGGAGGGGSPPQQLTQAQIDTVNGIVKAHIQRVDFAALVAPSVKAALDQVLPEVIKTVAGEVVKAVPQNPPAADKKGAGAGMSEEARNEMNQMRAQLEEMKKIAQDKDDKLKAAQHAERDGQIAGKLKTTLEAGKIRPELLEGGLAVLRTRIAADTKWTDDGPVVKVKRNAPGVGAFTEEIPLEQYAKEWLGTDEGKGYVAAPSGRGSGAGGGGRAPSGGSPSFVPQGGGQTPAGGNGKGGPPPISDHDFGNMVLAAYQGGADD